VGCSLGYVLSMTTLIISLVQPPSFMMNFGAFGTP